MRRAPKGASSRRRSPAGRSGSSSASAGSLQPVLDPAELSPARRAAGRRAVARACAIRRCAARILAEAPAPEQVEPAVAVPPAHRHALGPHLRDGRSARLRAAARGQRRRDRRAREPHARRGRLRLPDRGRKPKFPVLPGHRLCPGRPRARSARCCPIRRRCSGLSDGGAHCASIVDAGVPTYMLMHWARDRTRGAALAAGASGQAPDQRDRRFLRLDRSRPAGAGPARRRQPDRLSPAAGCTRPRSSTTCRPAAGASSSASRAMRATLVAGAPIFEHGDHTGALPGRLVRAGRLIGTRACAADEIPLSCPLWTWACLWFTQVISRPTFPALRLCRVLAHAAGIHRNGGTCAERGA